MMSFSKNMDEDLIGFDTDFFSIKLPNDWTFVESKVTVKFQSGGDNQYKIIIRVLKYDKKNTNKNRKSKFRKIIL